MKFEFQKIDVAHLRRLAEEQQRLDPAKRRVIRIVLTPYEWAEFMSNVGHACYTLTEGIYAHFRSYRIPAARPLSTSYVPGWDVYPEEIRTIEVVREDP